MKTVQVQILLPVMITLLFIACGKKGPGPETIRDLEFATGENHTLVVRADSTLWATGQNIYGQVGDGTTTNKSTPVQVMTGVKRVSTGSFHTLILKNDNTLWTADYNQYGQVGDGTTADRTTPFQLENIAGGLYHTLALNGDNTLWGGGGYNANGQLGDGTTINRPALVKVMLP